MNNLNDKSLITRQAVSEVLQTYWAEYKKYPFSSIVSIIAPALGTILVFFVPPLIIAELINTIVRDKSISFDTALPYILLFVGLWAMGEVLWRVAEHLMIRLEALGMSHIYKVAYKRLAERDHDFFANNFVGTLTRKLSNFARGFESLTDILIFNISTTIFPMLFAAVILWRYSPWIPAILFAWIVLGIFIGIPLIRKRSKLVTERHDASSKLSGRISDSITNIIAIKSFAKENKEEEEYARYTDDYISKFKKAADFQNLKYFSSMSPIYLASNATGLVAAIYFSEQLGLEAGVLVVIFSYYQSITQTFWNISRIYRSLESSVSEAAEFTQMFLEAPKIQDLFGSVELRPANYSIEFMNVGFMYQDEGKEDENMFLSNFNIKMKENERVGLVGPSGGGKTTITKLLLRFIDPRIGQIMIGDQNIREVTQKSLRESIGYVPQEPLLFHRSLFENIAYGKDGATKDEVSHAAKLARADEFIDVLPNGYETLVGERGIKLSGGQRQRIAIARAILKNAPILVLDEATSSLDSESEKYIQQGLWELMKDKTALVIAHRLSTIKHLDRILVLDGGKIVQDGTHDKLIQEPGLYATLWAHQSGAFLADE